MHYTTERKTQCDHCGEDCTTGGIASGDKHFCCVGCQSVYHLLNENNLCDYYRLNQRSGNSLRQPVRPDKFAFLDDVGIQAQLLRFRNETETHLAFYLPQIHCSSCLYLLENLHRLEPGIVSSTVDFPRKELSIVFLHPRFSMRQVAELLTSIGYEPYISLNDLGNPKPAFPKKMIYQLGVAGFCFANIMLMSFPEYLGLEAGADTALQGMFRILNLALALPVLLYSAQPFFKAAWQGLRQRYLNIDAPIALAILLTFGRSVYEMAHGISAGYFDSMAGIVFFMLVGRVLQQKTYRHLSFDRDYKAYFPIAVTVVDKDTERQSALPDIKVNDTLRIHHGELIPADGILTRGKALIDYSFVTGEAVPVVKEMGEIVYAGGKQTGGNIEVLTIKEVAQSYLTALWNKGHQKRQPSARHSFTDAISRYFTWGVLLLALAGAMYWAFFDTVRAWNVVTTVLIVACPCALLLGNTFTNGHILRILARNRFYLRHAQTIEDIAAIDHIVFDKTGTLTNPGGQQLHFIPNKANGQALTARQQALVAALAGHSTHPLSRALAKLGGGGKQYTVSGFREVAGQGIEGFVNGDLVTLGSAAFVKDSAQADGATQVHVAIEGCYMGCYRVSNHYRAALGPLAKQLQKRFNLSVVSGDTAAEKDNLLHLLGNRVRLLFGQRPHQKRAYVQQLQQQGQRVMMMGDGLNDAVALQQADVGVAIAEDTNHFTPASDAILEAGQLHQLPAFIQLCRANKNIVVASFVLSLCYNAIGLFFALQGILSPLVAAILMPVSSISILLLTFGGGSWAGRKLKMNEK
jgi:P-type Cu+ transporter